jgi:hypothetical protein
VPRSQSRSFSQALLFDLVDSLQRMSSLTQRVQAASITCRNGVHHGDESGVKSGCIAAAQRGILTAAQLVTVPLTACFGKLQLAHWRRLPARVRTNRAAG